MIKFYFSQVNKALLITALSLGMFISTNVNAQTMVTAVSSDSLCVGDTVKLAASFSGSMAASYTWADTTGAMSISSNSGDTVSVFPMVTTNYRIIGDTNGVKDTTYFTVKIRTTGPNVQILGDSVGCQGKTFMLIGTGASTYEWFSTASSTTPIATTDTITDASFTNRKYWVFGTDAGKCVGSDTLEFVANKNPREGLTGSIGGVEMDLANIPEACFDEEVTLKAQLGTNTYRWSSNSAISDTVGSTTKFTVASGVQTVVFTVDSSNGCSAELSKSFFSSTNKPAVTIDWLGDSIICIGDSTSVKANTAGAQNRYIWSPEASIVDPMSGTAVLFPSTTTTYKVVVLSSGCTASASATVEVRPLPDITLSQSSGGTPICKDQADTITITSATGAYFDWGYGVTSKAKVKSIAPGVTETIKITAYSTQGCSNSASITINVDTSCGINLNIPDFDAQSEVKTFVYSNNLNLNFGNVPAGLVSVDVLNITGSVVKSEDLGLIESNDSRLIDLEALTNGLYILRVRGENFEVVNKIYK